MTSKEQLVNVERCGVHQLDATNKITINEFPVIIYEYTNLKIQMIKYFTVFATLKKRHKRTRAPHRQLIIIYTYPF